ncbi:MAG: AAA family ATPase [Halobacteriota archaeon]|nr:AAA family ATPase [Halobacteriota archaeon]
MRIIAFVGLPASGKSEASKVAREMGLAVVVMGDVIREEVHRRGLLLTDENAGNVANDLRRVEGMGAIAKRCIPIIKEKETDVVVIDGIRGIAEVKRFRKEFGEGFRLIKVDTQLEERFQRLKGRARSDSLNNLDELRNRDERELRWGMKEAMDSADMVIGNSGALDNFREEVKSALNGFL